MKKEDKLPNTILARVSDDVHNLILDKIKWLGMTKSDYIRNCILKDLRK